MGTGGDLLFRAVTRQVPSALKGLTSVFGMDTGDPLRLCHRKLWLSSGAASDLLLRFASGLSLRNGAQVCVYIPSLPGPSVFLAGVPSALSLGPFPAPVQALPCPSEPPGSPGGAFPVRRLPSPGPPSVVRCVLARSTCALPSLPSGCPSVRYRSRLTGSACVQCCMG